MNQVIEVIYGQYYKYEIVKNTGLLKSPNFSIYRDGRYFKGGYSSLAQAVAVARAAG